MGRFVGSATAGLPVGVEIPFILSFFNPPKAQKRIALYLGYLAEPAVGIRDIKARVERERLLRAVYVHVLVRREGFEPMVDGVAIPALLVVVVAHLVVGDGQGERIVRVGQTVRHVTLRGEVAFAPVLGEGGGVCNAEVDVGYNAAEDGGPGTDDVRGFLKDGQRVFVVAAFVLVPECKFVSNADLLQS